MDLLDYVIDFKEPAGWRRSIVTILISKGRSCNCLGRRETCEMEHWSFWVDREAHDWLDVFCGLFCGLFSSCAICSARGYYTRAYVRSSERSVYLKSCEAISLAVVCLSPGGSGPGPVIPAPLLKSTVTGGYRRHSRFYLCNVNLKFW